MNQSPRAPLSIIKEERTKEGERLYELQIGPAHPGSGHMRIRVWMDGDIMARVDPDIGFVHRTMEKLGEKRQYIKAIPLVERASLPDTIHMNLAYVIALERLMGVEPPERAQYIRTVVAEMNRIMSHLYGIGIFGIFLGSSTAYMWPFADREPFIDLMQWLTGARITYSYIIPGGVRRDIPQGFKEQVEKALRYMENRIRDYDRLFIKNPVTVSRCIGVGKVSREEAAKLGIVGPNLRASGVKYDNRKVNPYAAYDKLDFEVPIFKEGDAYARLLIRFEEIKQSIRIIRQALKDMPEGDIIAESYYRQLPPLMKKIYESTRRVKFPGAILNIRPPKGEAIARVEAGRGEVFFYLISDGTPRPFRFRWVTPSFRNLHFFTHIAPGHRLADLPTIYGSIDYFPPEADR
jgi:NADH-quinone oxidoreductase subunit D